jgi:SAM-dependent methyltransferase
MTHSICHYVNPRTQATLVEESNFLRDPESGKIFPIINNIPRFCDKSNYSESFGFQWNRFDKTQIDGQSKSQQSEQRFYSETGWDPKDLAHCRVLEVGSGAGRFSEVFLRTTTGILHSIDYSSAVEANARNNIAYNDRLRLSQASIYEIPFPDNSFDRVFCMGVLQHTPSFEESVQALIKKTRVGGTIVVDFYPIKGWYTKIHSKYILRPITRRFSKPKLLHLIQTHIGWMLALFDALCALRLGVLTRIIPITDVRNFPHTLSKEQRREWAVMDTFDGLSPEYDNPQRVEDVERMFGRFGCEVTHAGWVSFEGGAAMVLRAIKREVIASYGGT